MSFSSVLNALGESTFAITQVIVADDCTGQTQEVVAGWPGTSAVLVRIRRESWLLGGQDLIDGTFFTGNLIALLNLGTLGPLGTDTVAEPKGGN